MKKKGKREGEKEKNKKGQDKKTKKGNFLPLPLDRP